MAATASQTRPGSSLSIGCGQPCVTPQNLHDRVQILPMTRNVAVPRAKHSERLGHFASRQTVGSDAADSTASTASDLPLYARDFFSQGGRRFLT
jgi:hypothetical protein